MSQNPTGLHSLLQVQRRCTFSLDVILMCDVGEPGFGSEPVQGLTLSQNVTRLYEDSFFICSVAVTTIRLVQPPPPHPPNNSSSIG
jgi:hypothetical protein